jgi:hypothetical protein
MKVVINTDFGGFGLSKIALETYAKIKGKSLGNVFHFDIERNDPVLVDIVEQLGVDANGNFAELKVVEIPDGISWYIEDYDGIETIHETHRSWN